MKRTLLLLSLAAILYIYLGGAGNSTVGAQKLFEKEKAEKGYVIPNNDRELASLIRKLTEGPSYGLIESKPPGGGILTDLAGGYQNVMLASLNHGEPIAACVSGIDEANAFLGRNLDTGESMPQFDFGHEPLSTIASRHGMTEMEFLFYNKLAAEAFQNKLATSPQTATITIVNGDGGGEGFNDSSARVPEGGNTGITLGQQRMNVFNQAAAIWSSFLDSAVPISVDAQFNPLAPCSPSGGVLGSAGATFTAANFGNAQFANTDYPIALANKQAGSDLVPANSEIVSQFNSNVDLACLGPGTRFYYGFDNSTPVNTVNLLIVVLHELGHGLGFASSAASLTVTNATNASPIVITTSNTHGLVNGDQVRIQNALGNTAANGVHTVNVLSPTTFELIGSAGNGAYTANSGVIRGLFRTGRPGIWARFMRDDSTGLFWNGMTTAERSISGENTNNLLWDGSSVRLGSGSLTAGKDPATGRVQLFTPGSFQQGSSVSHWNTAATPNLLMEPSINLGLPLDLDLTRQLMRDIGWYRDTTQDTVADTIMNVIPNSGFVTVGTNVNISWTNTGGFNRNVTIELSRDGGTTFTALATDIANTGSFSWAVTAPTSAQARIRVREADFADPAGVSSANFAISFAPTSARASISGRVLDSRGRPMMRALVMFTSSTGESFLARSNSFGYFRVEGLPVGHAYLAEVSTKGYSFAPQIISLNADISDMVFIARE